MYGGAAVAMPEPKKRQRAPGGGRKKVPDPKRSIASFKGSSEFADWFEELVEHLRMPTATVIEHALICLARERGFQKPPPPR